MTRHMLAVTLLATLAVVGCAKRHAVAHRPADHFAITVTKQGFEPPVLIVPAGKPVTLVVTRTTEYTCARDFVMASQEIAKPLPLDQPVEIQLSPQAPGDLRYACGTDMFKGIVRVK